MNAISSFFLLVFGRCFCLVAAGETCDLSAISYKLTRQVNEMRRAEDPPSIPFLLFVYAGKTATLV